MFIIFQPDITAPGVNILAAYCEDTSPTGSSFDERRVAFNVESGTSMSCPHIAGIVGLLKTLYPKWSPAAIRSAIMTTGNDFSLASLLFSFRFSILGLVCFLEIQ